MPLVSKILQSGTINTSLALTVSEILTLLICDLEKVGQDHEVHFLQLHHSMANVPIYKCLPHIFAPALTVSDIYKFQIF